MKAILRDSITTTIWGWIGKSAGFLVPIFLAMWFGASKETDAFFFAYGVIFMLSCVFASIGESIVVPFIVEAREKKEDVALLVSKILSVFTGCLACVAILLLLFSKPLISGVTRFSEDNVNLIYIILSMLTPLVILLVWNSVLVGLLNSFKSFHIPAVSPALRAVVILVMIFFFMETIGIYALPLGYIAGEALRLVFLLLMIKRKLGLRLRLSFGITENIKKIIKVSSFQIAGLVVLSLNPMIDKTFASWLNPGDVSILEYSDRLYMLVVAFTTAGFFPVILSHWSNQYYTEGCDRVAFKRQVVKTACIVFGISVVVFLIFISVRGPLVRIVYGHGKVSANDLVVIKNVFTCYLLGLVVYATGSVFTRVFMMLKETKLLMKLGVLNCIINAILDYVLIQSYGVTGLAIARSATVLIITLLLIVAFIRNSPGPLGGKET